MGGLEGFGGLGKAFWGLGVRLYRDGLGFNPKP